MPRILTRHPQPPPKLQQNKRIGHKQHRQASKKRTRPANPQIMKHSRRKQRKPSPKRRPHKIIPRQHRSRIPRIRMSLITKNPIEDQTPPDRKKHRPHNRHNPMHALKVPRPPKPEQRNRERERPHAGWGQLVFGCDVPVLVEMLRLVFGFPVEVARYYEDRSD